MASILPVLTIGLVKVQTGKTALSFPLPDNNLRGIQSDAEEGRK